MAAPGHQQWIHGCRGSLRAAIDRLPTDIRGVLEAHYDFRSDRTLYARWGDWYAWLCVAASGLLGGRDCKASACGFLRSARKTKLWLNTSKIYSNASPSSRNASSWCGAIFDPDTHRKTLIDLEAQISQPDFWSNQEKAQALLQQRKYAEAQVSADDKLVHSAADLEAFLEMAREETNVAQRDSLLGEVTKELLATDHYVSELETRTLLAGESDRLNAIMTIKPGAGGTESQDWAEMLLRMYLKWAERSGLKTTVLDSTPGEEAGDQVGYGSGGRRECVRVAGRGERGSPVGAHFAVRPSRAAAHLLRLGFCHPGNR